MTTHPSGDRQQALTRRISVCDKRWARECTKRIDSRSDEHRRAERDPPTEVILSHTASCEMAHFQNSGQHAVTSVCFSSAERRHVPGQNSRTAGILLIVKIETAWPYTEGGDSSRRPFLLSVVVTWFPTLSRDIQPFGSHTHSQTRTPYSLQAH